MLLPIYCRHSQWHVEWEPSFTLGNTHTIRHFMSYYYWFMFVFLWLCTPREGNFPDQTMVITYGQMLGQVCRCANVLKRMGKENWLHSPFLNIRQLLISRISFVSYPFLWLAYFNCLLFQWFQLIYSYLFTDSQLDSQEPNNFANIIETFLQQHHSISIAISATGFQSTCHVVCVCLCCLDPGVKKGDRVAIYLPMIPELVYTMLACARIGAVHSIVVSSSNKHPCCTLTPCTPTCY